MSTIRLTIPRPPFFHAGLCAVALASLCFVGCGPAGPVVAPVKGKVTLDGVPVHGITIHFYPQAGGRASTGESQTDGSYQLLYSIHEVGAMVGTHEVTVAYEDDAETSGIKRLKVPAKYSEEGSGLIVEVKSGQNEINLELTSN